MITQTKLDRLVSAIASLVRSQGIGVIANPARFRGLLKDEIGGELGPQIDLLIGALNSGVIGEIVEHRGIPPGEDAALRERLAQSVGAGNAAWVLDGWLRGLDLPGGSSAPVDVAGDTGATKVDTSPREFGQTRVAQTPPETRPKVPVAVVGGGVLVVLLAAAGLGLEINAHAKATTVVTNPTPAGHAAASIVDDAGVARISYASGDVGIRRGDDQNDLLAAAVNAPLFAGDLLATGSGANAEAHLSSDWLIRMDEQSQVRFEDLQPGDREVQLARGDIELRVFGHAQNGPPQVDTPSVAIVPVDAGAYRIEVTPDGRTEIAVRSGRAQINLPQGDQDVNAGQTAIITGPPANPQISFADDLGNDNFDAFNAGRDSSYAALIARSGGNTAADGMVELATYGHWTTTSYGRAWIPAESPQWTPYSEGHWAWTDGDGWTWIPDEPWGWAPYHSGRWFDDPGVGWAWVPGPPAAAWQPAQVAFFVSAGVLAWVALAPGEPYHPWYGNGAPAAVVYGRGVAFAAYRNARDVRAIRTFPLARIARGDFGRTAFVHTSDLHRYALLRGGVPIVPERGALRYAARPVSAIRPVGVASFAGRAHAPPIAFAGERARVAAAVRTAPRAPIAARGTARPATHVAHVVPRGVAGAAHVAHVAHLAPHTAPYNANAHVVAARPAAHPYAGHQAIAHPSVAHPSVAHSYTAAHSYTTRPRAAEPNVTRPRIPYASGVQQSAPRSYAQQRGYLPPRPAAAPRTNPVPAAHIPPRTNAAPAAEHKPSHR